MATGSIFYLADYVTRTSTIILMVYLFIPLGVGIPFSNVMVKRFGLIRSQQVYMAVGGIGLVSLAFMPVNWIPISLIIAGLGLSGQQTITYNILGYVIDDDEIRTGSRREGAFFGANALLTKPAQSVALFLTAFILEQSGFVTRAMNRGEIVLDQTESALFGIRAIVGLIPGVAMLLGILILAFFPIYGKKLAELKEKILQMHAEKESELAQVEMGRKSKD
jgi:GPH family glycoside/pentoside/hexuronide:cation symporter